MEKRMGNRKGYDIEGDVIIINRKLTELDRFVRDFLNVLKKYMDYLIVSGFVSIAVGRTRGTEDVDMLVPVVDNERFMRLFNDLEGHGFWCYQGDRAEEVYPYVERLESVRFARKNEMFPSIEFIPIDKSRRAKYFEFTHPQKMRVEDFEFKVPPIEFEIVYKETVLKGKKDIADAQHLRAFFSEMLRKEKFKEYEEVILEGE